MAHKKKKHVKEKRETEEEISMPAKKKLLKHLKKDDKEFRSQIKEDVKLKKSIMKAKNS